jgi:hypothetical protein
MARSSFDMSSMRSRHEAAAWLSRRGNVVAVFEDIPFRLVVGHDDAMTRDVWRVVGIVDPAAAPSGSPSSQPSQGHRDQVE